MDITQHTLDEILKYLDNNGYKFNHKNGNEKISLLIVNEDKTYDIYTKTDYEKNDGNCDYVNFDTFSLFGIVSTVDCGGMYIAIGLFENNKNITLKYFSKNKKNMYKFCLKYNI